MKKPSIILAVLSIGVFLSLSYTVFAVPPDKIILHTTILDLKSSRPQEIAFTLPDESYLLRIKHAGHKGQVTDVALNNRPIAANIPPHVSMRGDRITQYIHLPSGMMKRAGNSLAISFTEDYPPEVELTFTNYRQQLGKAVYIFFGDTTAFLGKKVFKLKNVLIAVTLLFLFFAASAKLLSAYSKIDNETASRRALFALLPLFIVFLIFWISVHVFRAYRMVITQEYFWIICICGMLLPLVVLLLKPKFEKISARFREHSFPNKLATTFMGLSIACAILMILRLGALAGVIADCAYFIFTAAVVLTFAGFAKQDGGLR